MSAHGPRGKAQLRPATPAPAVHAGLLRRQVPGRAARARGQGGRGESTADASAERGGAHEAHVV